MGRDALNLKGNLGDKNGVRRTGNPSEEGDPPGMPPHQLHDHDPFMRLCR
jgi:hypothetical protein